MNSNLEFVSRKERMGLEGIEINRLYANISKAIKIVKWKPNYSLSDGLKQTRE